jgi:hypothetical protein
MRVVRGWPVAVSQSGAVPSPEAVASKALAPMNTEKMTATFTPSSMTMAEGSLEHSAGSNTDPEPTSYSRGVLADAQQRYDDVIGDFPV